jgi:uncharacterized protein
MVGRLCQENLMTSTCSAVCRSSVTLKDGVFLHRFNLIRNYLLSLKSENLLQNFYLEAGLAGWTLSGATGGPQVDAFHWGWESPSCQLRGHFLGHWLSGAAQTYAITRDAQVKAKADHIISELARCQQANGGEWLGPTPEKYLHWLTQGKWAWAPQYLHHKTLMGLHDMYAFAGNEQALDLADKFADWFHAWTKPFTREQMDNILDFETGGMLEAFANLHSARPSQKYLDLIERYTRGRLFDALLDGKDPLTNMHANTTIPEVQGAARCYEVLGDERWRRIVEAYWRCAVTDRGAFCTGGQTSGEMWNPPHQLASRLGDRNQEHCVVYNMIRLADYLYRWTGEAQYLDYIERNLYNGILAQQNPHTGMVAYYLPMEPGAKKKWGHPTHDFWCCHGSVVQAHPMLQGLIYYRDGQGVTVAQYIPSQLKLDISGAQVTIEQSFDSQAGNTQAVDAKVAAWSRPQARPSSWLVRLGVTASAPTEFTLRLRLPEWLAGQPVVTINGQPTPADVAARGTLTLRRTWHHDQLTLEFPKALRTESLPDEQGTSAFIDGPVVLAGLTEKQVQLQGDAAQPWTILAPANERAWGSWLQDWRTINQPSALRFKPLYEVVDEPYTLYFPIRKP